MIKRMRHYHKCVTCDKFGVAYHIKTIIEIETIMCKECMEKLINKFGRKE